MVYLHVIRYANCKGTPRSGMVEGGSGSTHWPFRRPCQYSVHTKATPSKSLATTPRPLEDHAKFPFVSLLALETVVYGCVYGGVWRWWLRRVRASSRYHFMVRSSAGVWCGPYCPYIACLIKSVIEGEWEHKSIATGGMETKGIIFGLHGSRELILGEVRSENVKVFDIRDSFSGYWELISRKRGKQRSTFRDHVLSIYNLRVKVFYSEV